MEMGWMTDGWTAVDVKWVDDWIAGVLGGGSVDEWWKEAWSKGEAERWWKT